MKRKNQFLLVAMISFTAVILCIGIMINLEERHLLDVSYTWKTWTATAIGVVFAMSLVISLLMYFGTPEDKPKRSMVKLHISGEVHPELAKIIVEWDAEGEHMQLLFTQAAADKLADYLRSLGIVPIITSEIEVHELYSDKVVKKLVKVIG